jgi:proline iminopeptidase
LAYAITHPAKVKALVLRGIFMVRTEYNINSHSELQWLYQKGASHIFPDYWSEYLETIPKDERIDMIAAYYKRLTSSNENERLSAAKAWSKWECAISKLIPSEEKIAQASKDTWSLAFARIECHYFVNKGFFKSDSFILDNVDKIRHIPCLSLINYRYSCSREI